MDKKQEIVLEIPDEMPEKPKPVLAKKSKVKTEDEEIDDILQDLITNGFADQEEEELINVIKETCLICYNDVPESKIVWINDEPHDICTLCFITYLETQVKSLNVLKIACPHCSLELNEEFIEEFLTTDWAQRY